MNHFLWLQGQYFIVHAWNFQNKVIYLIHQPFQTAKHNIIMLLFFYPQLLINVLILWQIWHKYKTLCCCFQTITNDVSIYKWSCRCLNQNMLIYNINKKYLCSFLSFVPKLSIFYQMEYICCQYVLNHSVLRQIQSLVAVQSPIRVIFLTIRWRYLDRLIN